jgi:hypothetical protein
MGAVAMPFAMISFVLVLYLVVEVEQLKKQIGELTKKESSEPKIESPNSGAQ